MAQQQASPDAQAAKLKAASSLNARKRAVSLMNAGKFAEAFEVLKLALVDFPQDQDIRFLIGQCALELNRPGEAIVHFEAMLAASPNLPRVRLELARAYTADKRYDLAREQFNLVIASNPPPAVGENVQKFLTMIDSRRPWHGRLSASLMSDSNVNTGPGSASILAGAPTSQTITGRSDHAWNLIASLSHIHAVDNAFAWQSDVSVNLLDYHEENASDLDMLSVSTGPTWALGQYTVSIPLVHDRIKVGHDPYSHSTGIAPQLHYAVSPDLQLTSSLSLASRKHDKPSAVARNGQVHSVTGGARIRLSDALHLQPSLRYSREQTTEDYFDNSSLAASLGLTSSWPEGLTLFAQPTITQINYAAPDPFLAGACDGCNNTRRDWQYQFTVNLSRPIGKTGLSAALGYTYTRNDSNVGLNDYTRHQGTVMLTWIH